MMTKLLSLVLSILLTSYSWAGLEWTDSSTDRCDCGTTSFSGISGSVFVRVKPASINTGNYSTYIVMHYNFGKRLYLLQNNADFKYRLLNEEETDTGDNFTAGEWHTVAITWDKGANNYTVYFDGVATDSGAFDGIAFTNYIRFGASSTLDINYTFAGQMCDGRVYDRALSADEIMALHEGHGADGIDDGCVLHLPMDEYEDGTAASGSGSVRDITNTGNDGTPTGLVYRADELKPIRRMLQ
jgi:hypothetical protein